MEYYTSSEARRVLGNIRGNKLKSYVDSGIIKRYVPPGGKQGLYAKEEVDALAEKIRQFYRRDKKKEPETDGRVRAFNSA